MIASGYSLHLYCDTPGCHRKAEFDDESGAECWRQARRAGWKCRRKVGVAQCSGCAKAGKPFPVGDAL